MRLILKKRSVLVRNLDNLGYGSNRENLSGLEVGSRYRFVRGDIANQRTAREMVDWADAVVNFAAETHVDRSISSARLFVRTNFLGVYSLLEAIRKAKADVRFIQVGTDEEYGDISSGSFREEDGLRPSSPYSASKAAASMLVHAYHRTYGLKTIVTRCTNNYGPYQFPEKLIPKAIIRAKLGMKVPVYGTGRNVRDWIYVEDHCEALGAILDKGRAGEVYNISSGEELENSELVLRILEILGEPRSLIEYVEDRPGHDLRYSLDSSKTRREIGWKPKHAFPEALQKTVNWYSRNEKWWRPLADDRVLTPAPWKLRW